MVGILFFSFLQNSKLPYYASNCFRIHSEEIYYAGCVIMVVWIVALIADRCRIMFCTDADLSGHILV